MTGNSARPPGFLSRVLTRLGLSDVPSAQRDLLQVLVDRQVILEQRQQGLERELSELRLELFERRAGGTSSTEDDAALIDVASALREGLEAVHARQLRLETRLKELSSGTPARPEAPTLSQPVRSLAPSLTPELLATLLREVEIDPEGGPRAVEVSIQHARAEDLILAAQRHFGTRMSSAGPVYRAPNDFWMHVDFTDRWRRPILLDNAAARLCPGGRFTLVTVAGTEAPLAHPLLTLEMDKPVAGPEGPVRVLTWRRNLHTQPLTDAEIPERLPPEACRFRLERVGQDASVLRLRKGGRRRQRVRLTHLGEGTSWPSAAGRADARHAVRVGVRWLRGEIFVADGRTEIPVELAPGGTIEFDVDLMAVAGQGPLTAGRYEVRLEVVQELVRWFDDAGPPLRLEVEVR